MKPAKDLLERHEFLSIIRGHQVQIDGYKMHRWGGTSFPQVITVFSAPNYCGSYSNKGAVIVVENERMNIKQYKDVEPPFHLPGSIDLFAWSLPFLGDKISDMLSNIISRYDGRGKKSLDEVDLEKILAEGDGDNLDQTNVLKNKIKSVARMARMFKNLRENSEMLMTIKKLSPDGKIPRGLLLKGRPAIRD